MINFYTDPEHVGRFVGVMTNESSMISKIKQKYESDDRDLGEDERTRVSNVFRCPVLGFRTYSNSSF